MPRLLLFLVVAIVQSVPASAAILLARGSQWNYLKGTAEASAPVSAWRSPGFDDSAWSEDNAPFRYGDGNGGTVLSDMRGSYTTLFLRRTFNVSEVALISRLDLAVDYDDGFAVWINGSLVQAQNTPGNLVYNATADNNHESGAFEIFELANPQSFLVEGENTIAIQVFNVSLTSSDLMMNPELISTAPDSEPPVVSAISPAPGNVAELNEITITFSEPVTGIDAGDLTINDTPALSVTGSGEQYTFAFAAAPFGSATLAWSQDHGIRDTAVPANPFDANAPGEIRNYLIIDELAPTTVSILPPPNLIIRDLREVSVLFSEPVTGVEARDLLAGGVPASIVTGSGSGPYLFAFPAQGEGPLTLRWADDHNIADLAADPNPFPGGSWSYTLDPSASLGSLAINEFNASNRSGRTDEDGEATDWIELHNFGATPINIGGWSLSDTADEPGKFILPARTLPAGGFLVIHASGKDRAPADTGEIHANFKLAASGEYLGLFTPELPRSVADELAPAFPVQRNDHSYGRDNLGTWRYYSNPTPGSANGNSSIRGLLPPPHPNVARGFYSQPFNLHFTSANPSASIRYTTDGSEPTSTNGSLYTSPIRISSTRIVRAASFRSGYLPSEIVTHSYFYNTSSAIRSLPVVSISTNRSNLWGPTGIQEVNPRNTTNRGIAWERPASAELIHPDNGGFQENCGLRVQGGDYIRGRYNPTGGLPFSKYSFRLYFRGDYGPTMLDFPFFEESEVKEFDRITLRAGMNDHSNPFIVDEMVRRMQIESGNVGARGRFVNLFINGEYKGYYNATERIDDDFMRSWHGGDNAWDVIAQFGEVREGDNTEWSRMQTIVRRDLSVPANYQAALEVLDVDNFIDYLLVNVYGGTGDWPHNNWRAARERIPGAKFRFYVWDAEWSFGNQGRSVNGNTLTSELGGSSEIARLYQSLVQSPEFRLRWADRVHKLFFNGGPLEDARNLARFAEMRAEMSAVLPGMSTSIQSNWIPRRRDIIFNHMGNADLYRSDAAATFSQFGGSVPPGFALTMDSPGGTIFYTTDGSDPRAPLDPDAGGFRRTLLEEDAPKRILVPGNNTIGTTWTGGNEPFADASWRAGNGGVGYDEQTTYNDLIDIDVEAQMNDIRTSCYIRIPFAVTAADLEGVNFMQLHVRYDDGFAAYLNGVRIAGANAPATLSYDSGATGNNSDSSAVNLRGFNVSDFLGELKTGSNILAIHGLNDGLGSSDFLNSVTLEVGENLAGSVSPTAQEYTGPVSIETTTRVKARTLRSGVWSALTEAEFFTSPETRPLRITEIMYNPTGDSAYEFIELQNVGTHTADLSYLQFEGITFSFQRGTVLAPGAFLVLISNNDPAAFAERYPGVSVHGQFAGSLSNGGERLALLDGLDRTLLSVDYDDAAGWPAAADGEGYSLVLLDPAGDPDDPANWTSSGEIHGSPGAPNDMPAPPNVYFSEVLAWNESTVEHGGAFLPMVELSNRGNTPVNLAAWELTEDGALPGKFRFPTGTTLPPGGQLVLWCSEPRATPGLYTGFALSPDGGSLFLSSPSGERIDAFSFGFQIPDLSLSKVGSEWSLTAPTPGAPSGTPVPLAPQSSLSINEWSSNRIPGQSDWLELYNKHADLPVALRGLHLRSSDTTFRYGALSFLDARSFTRLWADDETGPQHVDFRLQAAGGTLALVDADGREVEHLSYPAQEEDVSSGRFPDGASTIRTFLNAASPGAPNYLPANPGLVFNEISTSPTGAPSSWLELKNTSSNPISLAGFSLVLGDRDGAPWPLAVAGTLPTGAHLVIWCDGSRPASSAVDDPNTGRALSPLGDRCYLFDDQGREIDRVLFGAQVSSHSIGRPSDSGSWNLLDIPTPGTMNSSAQSLGSVTSLRINEWLANSTPTQDDYVELYNTSSTLPVALGRLRLSDDLSTLGRDQYTLPPLSFIAPQGFVTFIADGSAATGHLPFNLDASGETLRLYRATGSTIINEVTWGIESEGIATGRLSDGGSQIGALPFQSPGSSNQEDPNPDQDGDGMFDSWERTYGLDPAIDDAEDDADGDFRTNLHEFLSATNPSDPSSFLRLDATSHGASGFEGEFQAQPGIHYVVEASDDLITWTQIDVIEASDNLRKAVFVDSTALAHRFYRLIAARVR